jgi:hypothetical protein
MMAIDSDRLLHRLRECVMDGGEDYNRGYCNNCNADLTAADVEAGECSNCHSAIESDDEDLQDDDLSARGTDE